jgi:hypothetical protein
MGFHDHPFWMGKISIQYEAGLSRLPIFYHQGELLEG